MLSPFETCPRCRKLVLDRSLCMESVLDGAAHLICLPCARDEDDQIDYYGTTALPEILASYASANKVAA